MHSSNMKVSALDLMTAILEGGRVDHSNMSSASGKPMPLPPSLAILLENRELMMLLTTWVAVLIGCVVALVWRRSTGQRSAKGIEPPKQVVAKLLEEEPELDDGKKKVTIFFGTQTSTAEGFAKAC